MVTHEIAVAGAEMLAVSPDGLHAVVAGADVATLVEIGRARLELVNALILPEEHLPTGSSQGEFTGVALHPSGQYALLAVKDADETNLATFDEVPGKVLVVSLPALEVLGEVSVGRGPDSVAISRSGEFAVVANEDEEDEADLTNPARRAGSLSVLDLRAGPAAITKVEVALPAQGIPFFSHDPQPETVKIAPDDSFILATLQENNAISRVEVPSPLPVPLTAEAFSVEHFDAGVRHGLGLVTGGAGSETCASSAYDLSLRQDFTSAREPDGLAITPDGRYFITADEDNLTSLNAQAHEGTPLSPHGARSISMYDAASGELLGDSGDTIEQAVVASRLPQRCSSKGPEPEVVTVGEVMGRVLAFAALERSDAITIHDVTEPDNIRLLDLVVLNPGALAADAPADYEPEGIELIPGRDLVIVSNPASGSVSLVELRFHGVRGGASGAGVQPGATPDVVLSELSVTPTQSWVELQNRGSAAAAIGQLQLVSGSGGIYTFPNGTTLPANGYLRVESLGFELGAEDSLSLYTPSAELLDVHAWSAPVSTLSRCSDFGLVFWPTTGADGSGSPTPGFANDCIPLTVAGQAQVVLNEVRSQGDDFIELYNRGASAVDLSSWMLRDSGTDTPFVFPAGTTIGAGEHLVIDGDFAGAAPPSLAFGLGSADSVTLYSPYDVSVDSHSWTAHVNTTSRCPDGTGDLFAPAPETRGAANSCL